MKYGSFLKKLATQTDLPVNFLHQQMIAAIKRLNGNKDYINERTLGNLVREFNKRFNERIKNSYSYEPLKFAASTSIYDAKRRNLLTRFLLMIWVFTVMREQLTMTSTCMTGRHCVMTVLIQNSKF